MDSSNSELLRTADGIGCRLGRQAIWHEDRCNWLGAQSMERQPGGAYQGVTYEALGPDLYSGTAGVALFLAELYSEIGSAADTQGRVGRDPAGAVPVGCGPGVRTAGLV